MQYAQMVDLLDQAKDAGASDEPAASQLRVGFEYWLAGQPWRGQLTEEEEEALWIAYQEGFGIK